MKPVTVGNRWVAVALFLSAMFIVLFPITDSDIFWHLATSREMVAQQALLSDDPFSFAPTIHPWINLHWLFQLIVYGVHSLAGLYGLIILKAVLFASAAVLTFGSFSGPRMLLRFAVSLFALFQVRWLVLERPVMFTLVFLVLFLACLEKFRDSGRWKWLGMLIPLQILWVNIQGLSPLGLVVTGAFMIEALLVRDLLTRVRPLLLLLTALLLCAFVNPYGLKGALYPVKLLMRILPGADPLYSLGIAENVPLLQAQGHEQWVLITVLLLGAFHLALILGFRRQVRIAHSLLVTVFLFLALMAFRNALLFTLVSLFSINALLVAAPARESSSLRAGWRAWTPVILWVMILYPVSAQVRAVPAYRGLHGLSPYRFGEGGARYLESHPVSGNLFNADRFGGYLIWTLGTGKKIFMDGRFMLRPKEVFEEYLGVLDHPERFEDLVLKYDLTHALLPVAVFDRFKPLVRYLSESPQWTQVFNDGASVLFVKKKSPPYL